MPDTDTLETINREQLATATDRLLLGGGRAETRRRSAPLAPHARGSIPSIAYAAHVRGSTPVTPALPGRESIPSIARAPVVRGSHPRLLHRPLACGSPWIAPTAPRPFDPHQERTVPVRHRALSAQRSGSAVGRAARP